MVNLPKVIHFEIGVDDPKRAVKFYQDVFGWRINKWGPMDYWLIKAGEDNEPGINGALMERPDPKTTTVNTISVPSVDEFMKKVEKSGGKAMDEKRPIPGVGYFAYCQDTEGNKFGILQEDTSAK